MNNLTVPLLLQLLYYLVGEIKQSDGTTQGPVFDQSDFDKRAYAQFGAKSGLKPNKFWPSAKDIEVW